MSKSVDDYLASHADWSGILKQLRAILLERGLKETIKWGAPVYTANGRNVVGIGAFKSYAGLWFFDGALLSDPAGVLINAQEGKTTALRQWRFQAGQSIDPEQVRAYLDEAIANAAAGKRVEPVPKPAPSIPELLASALAQDTDLRAAFDGLPAGKQREYAEHVAQAKREDTRQRRLAKILPMIKRGEGLNDRYRNC